MLEHLLYALRLGLGILGLWAFLAAGNAIAAATGAPVPGSIIGMLALWLALEAGVVRLSWLDAGAGLLLRWLGLLFVPVGVGFLQYAAAGAAWVPVLAAVALGVLLSLAVTGHLVQRTAGRG
jgi:holin-like protein